MKIQNHAEGSEGWGLWLRAGDPSRGLGFSDGSKSSRPPSPKDSGDDTKARGKREEWMGKESADDPGRDTSSKLGADDSVVPCRISVTGAPKSRNKVFLDNSQ
jgi:hypothetical protein